MLAAEKRQTSKRRIGRGVRPGSERQTQPFDAARQAPPRMRLVPKTEASMELLQASERIARNIPLDSPPSISSAASYSETHSPEPKTTRSQSMCQCVVM